MERKKILFCIRDFAHGGIPKCLQQLLTLIDTSKYEIDLFCGYQEGVYKGQMPNCNVIPQDWLFWAFMANYRKQKGVVRYVAIAIKTIRSLLKRVGFDWYEFHIKQMAKRLQKRNYDTYVAYSEGFPTQLCSYVNSQHKICWIHCDYDWVASAVEDLGKELSFYSSFERIIPVSKATEDAFCRTFPQLAARTMVINNVIDIDSIKLRISQPLDSCDSAYFSKDRFSILSVGRICYQKHFELIPITARKLKERGLMFHWSIVGIGPDNELQSVVNEIELQNVSDCVSLLGPKTNPYNYMNQSDLFVVTSRYESYPTVINEAKIAGTPIVSTNFNAVNEIMDERYGLIVPVEQLADAIEKMMIDKGYYSQIKDNLSTFEYSNDAILNQIYDNI